MKRVLLAGQPNCGKSSIFNMITGAKQHIANYPGITVEKKVGYYKDGSDEVEVVDLPGTYSLSSFTQEEVVARESILNENPDLVLNVVDASNLERNLYLTFQLLEMNAPTILTLNMIDIVRSRGYELDKDVLEKELGLSAVEVSAKKGIGKSELYEKIRSFKANKKEFKLNYGSLEAPIEEVVNIIDKNYDLNLESRWLAIKVFEWDEKVIELLSAKVEIFEEIRRVYDRFREANETPSGQIIAQVRYEKAEEIIEKSIVGELSDKETFSQKLDKILCHRIIGPIILVFTLYLFFQAVLGTDAFIQPRWQKILGTVREALVNMLPVESLINEGTIKTLVGYNLINGGFALLSYIPMFLILFTLVGIMEDSGYMARIAFMLDKLLKLFGLHGQSVLPLLLGGVGMGGCAIPGIMATRGMKDERAKLVTRLVVPILNCGAKIPFYLMIVAAFFRENAALILMVFYAFMFFVVLIVAKIFDAFVVKGEKSPFILELPEYHMPSMLMVLRGAFNKIKSFVMRIGTVILPFMALMWVITSLPGLPEEKVAEYQSRYEEVQESFTKKAGKKNNYLDNFDTEEERLEFFAYSRAMRKKLKKIKDNERVQIVKVDDEFKAKNSVYFEAMALGDTSQVDDMNLYEAYIEEYKEKVTPIKTESINRYDEISSVELIENPEYYKITTKGKYYFSDENIKLIKDYAKTYRAETKGLSGEVLEAKVEELQKTNPLEVNVYKDSKVKIKSNYIDDKDAKKIEKAYFGTLIRGANKLKKERKDYVVEESIGGKFGKFMEPFTLLAGFDWRVNLAFISTFAAKENFVAVINGIFGISVDESGQLIGAPWTVLNGLCLMIALALFPPCIPTLVLVKTETKKLKWMLFVTTYPIVLGYVMSILIYQIGTLLGIG